MEASRNAISSLVFKRAVSFSRVLVNTSLLVSKVAPRSLKQLRGRVGWKCRILCLFRDVLAQVPLPRTLLRLGSPPGLRRTAACSTPTGMCMGLVSTPLCSCFHRPRLVCQSVSVRGLGGAVRLPHNYAVSCVRPVTQLNVLYLDRLTLECSGQMSP